MTTTPNECRLETTVANRPTSPSGRVLHTERGSLAILPAEMAARIKPGAKVTVTIELAPATERINAFDAARDGRTIGGDEVWRAQRFDQGHVEAYRRPPRHHHAIAADADGMIEVDAL